MSLQRKRETEESKRDFRLLEEKRVDPRSAILRWLTRANALQRPNTFALVDTRFTLKNDANIKTQMGQNSRK